MKNGKKQLLKEINITIEMLEACSGETDIDKDIFDSLYEEVKNTPLPLIKQHELYKIRRVSNSFSLRLENTKGEVLAIIKDIELDTVKELVMTE